MTPPVDPSIFRDLMASLATGVTIVTTRAADGRLQGLTVSACCSVSLTPPQLLVCLMNGSSSLAAIRDSGHFAVNILKGDQKWIAERFASERVDKFSGVPYDPGDFGLPLVRSALAHITCQIVDEHRSGDHIILIGSVIGGAAFPGQPLGHFRRRYYNWEVTSSGAGS